MVSIIALSWYCVSKAKCGISDGQTPKLLPICLALIAFNFFHTLGILLIEIRDAVKNYLADFFRLGGTPLPLPLSDEIKKISLRPIPRLFF